MARIKSIGTWIKRHGWGLSYAWCGVAFYAGPAFAGLNPHGVADGFDERALILSLTALAAWPIWWLQSEMRKRNGG